MVVWVLFVANRGDQWGKVVNTSTSQHPSQQTFMYGTQHTSQMPLPPTAIAGSGTRRGAR